ncbi:MAG: hypothetical protein JNM27_09465 [Leptospirales bacterium]|nr:hypothetical protein [Leptospirales bacterium]
MKGQLVFYSLKDLPDDLQMIDEMDLSVKWETVIDPDSPPAAQFSGIEELNALFEERIKKILREKGGQCIHVKSEKIAHSRNYAHSSSIITGDYHFIVYGVKKIE